MKTKREIMHVLMCGSKLNVKGGMVTVTKNYLEYQNWEKYRITYIPTHVERHKLVVAIYFLGSFFRILWTLAFGHVDVIHMHTAERGSFYRKAIIVRVGKWFKVPTIMHHHAAHFEEFYEGLSKRKKKFVVKTLELADRNLVLSQNLIPMILSKAPNAKVEVLYNAVQTREKRQYNEQAMDLLFLGRLGQRKGTYDVLDALQQIDEQLDKNIRINLCGDGEVEKVKEQVKEKKLEHRIAHIGWITKELKENILENTMLHVLPSYHEGLPMSILETMSYGIPNISTDIASIPEVILPGKNGILIHPGQITKLGQAIIQLAQDRKLRETYSKASYQLIQERHSFETQIQHLKTIYDKVRKESTAG